MNHKLLAICALTALSMGMVACDDDNGSTAKQDKPGTLCNAHCDGNVAVSCDANGNENRKTCENGCDPTTNVCNKTAAKTCSHVGDQCIGGSIVSCVAGVVVRESSCGSIGCVDGASACNKVVCNDGAKRCSSDGKPEVCSKNAWVAAKDESGAAITCEYGCKNGECEKPKEAFGDCPAGYDAECNKMYPGSVCYENGGKYYCGNPCTTVNEETEDCQYDSDYGFIHTYYKCSLGANDRMIAIPYDGELCYSCSADGKTCGGKLVSDQGDECIEETRPDACVDGIYSYCSYFDEEVVAEPCDVAYGKDYECATIDDEVGCYEKCTEPTTKCALNELYALFGYEVYETVGYDCTSGHLVADYNNYEMCEGGCTEDGKACAPVKYTECDASYIAQCATKYGINYTCYAIDGEPTNCVEKCDPTGSAKTKDVCEYDEDYEETDTNHYVCTPFEGETTKGFFKYDDYDMCNNDCAESGDACDEYGIYGEKCEAGTADACIVNNTAIKSCVSGYSEITLCDEGTSCLSIAVDGKDKLSCVSASDVTEDEVGSTRNTCVSKTASGITSYSYVSKVVVKGADDKNYWYTTESVSCMGSCLDTKADDDTTTVLGCQSISALEGTDCDAAAESKKCDNTAALQCQNGKWTAVGDCTVLSGEGNVCLINGSGNLACAEPCDTENDTKTVCTVDEGGDYYTNYKCTKNKGDQKVYWAKSGSSSPCSSGRCESPSACAKAFPAEGGPCVYGEYEEKCTNGYVDYCYKGEITALKCRDNTVCAVITSENYSNCFEPSDECSTLGAESTSCVDEYSYSYEDRLICAAADNGKNYWYIDDELDCIGYCDDNGETCDEDGYYDYDDEDYDYDY